MGVEELLRLEYCCLCIQHLKAWLQLKEFFFNGSKFVKVVPWPGCYLKRKGDVGLFFLMFSSDILFSLIYISQGQEAMPSGKTVLEILFWECDEIGGKYQGGLDAILISLDILRAIGHHWRFLNPIIKSSSFRGCGFKSCISFLWLL